MATKASELHESTVSGSSQRPSVADTFVQHVWFWETVPSDAKDVLTAPALNHIEHHKYVAGEYSWLDKICNPFWNALVEYLPTWLAPNLVTLWGATHCLLSYLLTWYYAPLGVEAVPSWLLILNGYCLFVAYTLDCLDGKQARRTGSSTPLGQLLDHGLDSLCMLAHISAIQAWLRAGETLTLQLILQYSFCMAQWEEYHTRILPHATGPIGVTEVNYGMSLASLLLGTVWKEETTNPDYGIFDGLVLDSVNVWFERGYLSRRIVDLGLDLLPVSLTESVGKSERLSFLLQEVDWKSVVLFSWCSTMVLLCLLSAGRVARHLKSAKKFVCAILQLASPLAIVWLSSINEFSFFDHPEEIAKTIRLTIRWKSLAIGLLFCFITIKLIVYSMARQPMAVVQWDLLPLAGGIWMTLFDSRLTAMGHVLLWKVLSGYWGYRLLSWNTAAARQICDRLNIYIWSIQKRKNE